MATRKDSAEAIETEIVSVPKHESPRVGNHGERFTRAKSKEILKKTTGSEAKQAIEVEKQQAAAAG